MSGRRMLCHHRTAGNAKTSLIDFVSIPACPLLTFTMSKLGGLYCRMDDMCLGVECCVTIELLEMPRLA